MDDVQINIINQASDITYIYHQYKDCEKCPLHQVGNTMLHKSLIIKNYYQSIFAVSLENKDYMLPAEFSKICQPATFLVNGGKYNLTILPDSNCSLYYISGSDNLLSIFSFLVFFTIVFFAVFHQVRSFLSTDLNSSHSYSSLPSYSGVNNRGSSDGAYREFHEHFPNEFRNVERKARFRSVDVFRGITIFLMIFVNYGAGEFQNLKHAAWNGLNLADIVFPFFIFIMGVSVAISMKNLIIESLARLFLHLSSIFKRSLKLLILGLFINSCGNPSFKTLRIPGVLQRFAFCYFFVASTHIFSKYLRYHCRYESFEKVFRAFPFIAEFCLGLASLLLHVSFTFFWHYSSDCPVGYIGPGGLGDEMKFINCTGGAAKAIDLFLFGKNHSYKRFFGSILYDPKGKFNLHHDPEGFLGSWTSIILTLIGFSFGRILLITFLSEQVEAIVPRVDVYISASQRARNENAAQSANQSPKASASFRYHLWTGIFLFICFGLFYITDFMLLIPVNKQLWSLSFIFLTGGIAILSLFILNAIIMEYCTVNDSAGDSYSVREVIDDQNPVDNHQSVLGYGFIETLIYPFECAGKNAILLYVGHEIVKKMIPFNFVVSDSTALHWAHLPFLASNLCGATFWIMISVFCDSWKLYFKI